MNIETPCDFRCPAGCGELEGVCCLRGHESRVAIGSCDDCGYVGYINRPAKQWFQDFYAADWDANARDDQEEVRKLVRAEVQRPQPALNMVQACNPKPTDRILEFGCGYGLVLSQLSQLGFKNVSGVEPCQHRAKIAASELCLDVHCGELSAMDGKYDLIYSAHVLEHCYDPDEVIGQCARLQVNGGRLAINVPDAKYEPTMGQILFLPHLHSFTDLSLSNLLARHGYETFATSRDGRNITVLALKTNEAAMRQCSSDATVAVVEKFKRALSMAGDDLWWNSDNDQTASHCQVNWKRPRCITVEPCKPVTGHPVEIQFQGPVQLCVK